MSKNRKWFFPDFFTERFRYLRVSLALVLGLVGAKMLAAHPLAHWLGPNTNFWLLGVIVLILVGGAVASVVVTKNETPST